MSKKSSSPDPRKQKNKDQEHLEQEARHTAELFDLVTRSSNQLVYEYTPADRRILWSGAIREVTGYSPDEFRTIDIEEWERHIHPGDRVRADQALKEAEKSRKKFHILYRFLRKDGSYVHVEDEGIFIDADDDERMVGTMKDVSERVRLEREATEAKDFLSSVLGNVTDPIFVKDDQHRWIMLNDAFCSFMGHSREELIGKSDYDFFPRDQAKVFWEKDAEVFRIEKENTNEEQFTDANGVEHTIVTKKNIFTDSKGNKILVGVIRDITDRKRAEEELRTNQTKYKTLFDSAGDAIMLLTPEKGFTGGNPATIKLFGCRDEQEFTSNSPDKLSPEYQPDGSLSSVKAQQMMAIALEKGSHFFEWTHRRVNGEEFFATVLLTKMELMGKPVLQATVRNITESRKAEEVMRKLQNEQQIILDSVRAMIFYKDKENRLIRVNREFCDIMGKTKEQLEGKSLFDLYPKEQAEAFWKDDKEVIATGKPKLGILEPMLAHENTRWRLTDKIPYRNERGEIIGIIGFSVDITELQKTREKLEKEAENAMKFLQAVEASSIATIITSTEPAILYANPAWEKLTGYSEEEAIGKNPRILQSGKTSKEMYPQMWDTILNNKEFMTEEIVNRRKNGTEFNAELRVYPIAENGKVKFFAGLQTDITLRLRSDQAKSEFMSLASHQLRTPLTGLRWGIAMLKKKGSLTAEQESIADDLQDATARMAESINVMIHLSRIESGKMEVKNAPVQLSVFLNSLCQEFHPQAEMRHLHCNFQIEDDATLTTDSSLLREIMENLISNAIKYTPEGGEVEMHTKNLGSSVRISIRDSGYGIPVDQQDKVFSKFFRGTNVTDKIPDGTGLGLYLVYSLTSLLDGTISFVSIENEGTTFTLTLPLTPPAHE